MPRKEKYDYEMLFWKKIYWHKVQFPHSSQFVIADPLWIHGRPFLLEYQNNVTNERNAVKNRKAGTCAVPSDSCT